MSFPDSPWDLYMVSHTRCSKYEDVKVFLLVFPEKNPSGILVMGQEEAWRIKITLYPDFQPILSANSSLLHPHMPTGPKSPGTWEGKLSPVSQNSLLRAPVGQPPSLCKTNSFCYQVCWIISFLDGSFPLFFILEVNTFRNLSLSLFSWSLGKGRRILKENVWNQI